MITVEIRNDELRALKTNGLRTKKIIKGFSLPMEISVLEDMVDGDLKPITEKINELLKGLEDKNYQRESYTVLLNLEEVMTQKVEIPKVKDKEIPFTINSALVRDRVPISQDSVTSFSILQDKGKDKKLRSKTYKILTHIIDEVFIDGVMNTFAHLKLRIKYIDVTPNTLIKAFNASSHFESDYPLSLIVDLSENNVRYYQFKDKEFSLGYLDKAEKDEEDYLDLFEANVYQFLDEYGDHTLDDMNILLVGDDYLIKLVLLNFQGIFNIGRFSEGFIQHKKQEFDQVDKFINNLGALIRNDKLLSSHSKFDVNLLDRDKLSKERREADNLRYIAILGVLVILAIGSYLFILKVSNDRIASENEQLEALVGASLTPGGDGGGFDGFKPGESPADRNRELNVYEDVLEDLYEIENYLVLSKYPYSSKVYSAIMDNIPPMGSVVKVIYREGTIEIQYRTVKESTFKEYVSNLNSVDMLSSVDYSGYSLSGDSYSGSIFVEIKREEG